MPYLMVSFCSVDNKRLELGRRREARKGSCGRIEGRAMAESRGVLLAKRRGVDDGDLGGRKGCKVSNIRDRRTRNGCIVCWLALWGTSLGADEMMRTDISEKGFTDLFCMIQTLPRLLMYMIYLIPNSILHASSRTYDVQDSRFAEIAVGSRVDQMREVLSGV